MAAASRTASAAPFRNRPAARPPKHRKGIPKPTPASTVRTPARRERRQHRDGEGDDDVESLAASRARKRRRTDGSGDRGVAAGPAEDASDVESNGPDWDGCSDQEEPANTSDDGQDEGDDDDRQNRKSAETGDDCEDEDGDSEQGESADAGDDDESRDERDNGNALLAEEDDDDKPPVISIPVPSRVKKAFELTPKPLPPSPPNPLPPNPLPPSSVPTLSAPVDPAATFSSLGIDPWLVQSLKIMAIHRPTGIQKSCIPEILRGRDCIGGSRTGSGKTVAFAAPILQRWAEDPSAVFAVVLTPTRELALQIFEQFNAISAPQSLRALLVTGGADMRAQAISLARRPHVVIATPGRLADHLRTSGEDAAAGLRRARFVVLDEADRLLDARGPGSMLPDVEECLSALPPPAGRQTLLFTATMTAEVRALRGMPPRPGKAPAFVCEVDAAAAAVPDSLAQRHLQVPVTHREHYLHVFLSTAGNAERTAIVFCNRARTAEFLHHLLRLLGHRVTSLHSGLPQRQRTDNLARFRAAAARILVATDVAARGLDIPEVGLVLNYDVPRDPDDYIHRVGRTARAGRAGEAVTFVGQRDVDLVLAVEARAGRRMDAWAEEGVNLDARVVRDVVKLVSEKKREALLEMEEGRDVGGRRRIVKRKLRAE